MSEQTLIKRLTQHSSDCALFTDPERGVCDCLFAYDEVSEAAARIEELEATAYCVHCDDEVCAACQLCKGCNNYVCEACVTKHEHWFKVNGTNHGGLRAAAEAAKE